MNHHNVELSKMRENIEQIETRNRKLEVFACVCLSVWVSVVRENVSGFFICFQLQKKNRMLLSKELQRVLKDLELSDEALEQLKRPSFR